MKKVALVTGASRGIGKATAENLAADHHVIVAGTNASRVHDVVTSLPNAQGFVADLADISALEAAWESLGLDRLDVVVHSAGLAEMATVAEATAEQWQRTFTLNVFAVAELTRLTLPLLRETDGQVIAINSGSGYRAGPKGALYSGSKFALRAFTDALREEERGRVRVTSIHPGRVDTDMQVALQESMGNTQYDGARYISAEAVATTVRCAIDNEAASMVEELSIRPVMS